MFSRKYGIIISVCSLVAFILGLIFDIHGAFAVLFILLFFFFLASIIPKHSKIRYICGGFLIMLGLPGLFVPGTNKIFGITAVISGLFFIFSFITSWAIKNKQ